MRWELDWEYRAEPVFPGEFRPDSAQRAVIDHHRLSPGSLLVLGAAGSGKTRTLVHAVADRVQSGVDPASILVLTFGKRAVREFREALASVIESVSLPTIATFHSLAFSLAMSEGSGSLSVLSGAEEDARIIEIIKGMREDSSTSWPPSLLGASHTRAFAREIRAVIARLKELHMSGADLIALGEAEDRAEWVVAGHIAANEAEVSALEGVVDYSQLLMQSVDLVAGSAALRGIKYLFIDEYQEVGALQQSFIREIIRTGNSGLGVSEFIAAGNPNEVIFSFRGSESGVVEQFQTEFPGSQQIHLDSLWRSSEIIGRAAECVFPRGPAIAYQHFPVPADFSSARIERYGNRNARAAFIAQQIRTAHIDHGVPWREMSVIGRATSDLPVITRALARENIPVVVATDDIPLAAEPAVSTLLGLLWTALAPAETTAQSVQDLLTGPFCGLDASDIRRLGRALRKSDRTIGSAELTRRLIVSGNASDIPAEIGGHGSSLDSDIAVRIIRLQGLLKQLRERIESQQSVPEILWLAWTGGEKYAHGWPERLQASALRHSAHAHHDLDAIMALFDSAERFTARGRHGLLNFVHALTQQKLPAEPVAARGLRADAVQVMTVHQSKGQQWQRVWIVGLEEGIWPNLVVRGSVLHPDEITPTGIGPGANPVALMREERNLFYVATTRACESVTFTCIDQGAVGGDQPSRFIGDLVKAGIPDHIFTGYPRSRATWSGLAAELRMVLADPDASIELKESAGRILADMGPSVAPDTWWGLADITDSTRPVRPRDMPLHMSGSSLDSLITCPLKWFLDKEVKAQVSRGAATAFGSIVHAVAEYVAKGAVPEDLAAMQELITGSWRNVVYESPWQSSAELEQAHQAAARFLRYHQKSDRIYLQAEGLLSAEIEVVTPSGVTEKISLTGYVDRIEGDSEGRLVAIDLKNMRNQVSPGKIPEHGQLGVYQLLLKDRQPEILKATHADRDSDTPDPIGAALIQLRVEDKTGMPKTQSQVALDCAEDPEWIERKLGEAAEIIRNETFIPIVGEECTFCSYHSVCPTKTGTIFEPSYQEESDD
jgi:superfamily I DNA/RNA helicase